MAKRQIGLIGGLAVNAGVYYYQELARRHASNAERSMKLMLIHADIDNVLAFVASGDRHRLAVYLAGLIDQLEAGGCSAIAITAVAPHICIDELRSITTTQLIDILELTRSYVENVLPYDRIAIFGNKAVVATNVFGAVAEAKVVKPSNRTLEKIHATYNEIALSGKRGSEDEYRALDELAAELRSQGAEAILLAGTDLSSFYATRPPGYQFVDLAQLHIEAIAKL